jgi:hypothetical protein
MCFRWVKADEHPQPRCRVVKQNETGALEDGRADEPPTDAAGAESGGRE